MLERGGVERFWKGQGERGGKQGARESGEQVQVEMKCEKTKKVAKKKSVIEKGRMVVYVKGKFLSTGTTYQSEKKERKVSFLLAIPARNA